MNFKLAREPQRDLKGHTAASFWTTVCSSEEGGFLKDTDAMSALHITDEIIALDTDIEWTHYTQPNILHTMKHSLTKYEVKVKDTLTEHYQTPKIQISREGILLTKQHQW